MSDYYLSSKERYVISLSGISDLSLRKIGRRSRHQLGCGFELLRRFGIEFKNVDPALSQILPAIFDLIQG